MEKKDGEWIAENKDNIAKPVTGFEDYIVFKDGKIYSTKTCKYLKKAEDQKGYDRVKFYKRVNGKKKGFTQKVHRVVAKEFISNPDHYPQINHIDENKKNNNCENLEWCSNKYNANYGNHGAVLSERIKATRPPLTPQRIEALKQRSVRRVDQYTLSGEFIKTWDSIKEAQNEYGLIHIGEVCNNKRPHAGGYLWKYHDNVNERIKRDKPIEDKSYLNEYSRYRCDS